MFHRKPLMAAGLLAAASLLPVALSGPVTGAAGNASSKHTAPNCAETMCAEVANPASVFGNNYYGILIGGGDNNALIKDNTLYGFPLDRGLAHLARR